MDRRLIVVGLLATVAALIGIDARSTDGARVSGDEPQYLLTAISISEDLDLDIGDELADRRHLPFHEIPLDQQTVDVDGNGQRLSPHDPLLPALLAGPVRAGGWVGAKATLAAMAGLTAGLAAFVAERRFGVSGRTAALVVGAFAVTAPLATYGTQVYPAIPAALAVMVAVAGVTAPRPDGGPLPVGATVAVVAAIIALPWLSVKYAPLALILAVALLRRVARPWSVVAVLALAAITYAVVHQRVYGGWTVYAAGDHFVGGELDVVGTDPDHWGRTRRLLGLLVDRGFGVAAWNPAYLLAVPALAHLIRRRPTGTALLTALVAAGWGTATWVALTMHGWWWPGRQIVPVLPLLAVAVAVWADGPGRRLLAVLGAAAAGLVSWWWIAWETSTGRRALIVDFEQTANPWYRLWRLVLPDHRAMAGTDVALSVVWVVVLAGAATVAWRRAGREGPAPSADPTGRPAAAARPLAAPGAGRP